ncbi:MAG: DUF6788 family protein [Acidimicrobiales bacterium]
MRRHTRCGNHNCHCDGEPPELHGPYMQWTRTDANRTVSRIWSDEQLSRYQGWLDNARRARDTLSDLEALAISTVKRDESDRRTRSGQRTRGSQARKSRRRGHVTCGT